MTASDEQTGSDPQRIASWLLPTFGYVLFVGALGVASKLALEDLDWQQVTFWSTLVYLTGGAILYRQSGWQPVMSKATVAAMASAVFSALGLVTLYVALGAGDVGEVIPVTSSYPVVTLILAAVFLRERVTAKQVIGTLLIVIGVIVLTVF